MSDPTDHHDHHDHLDPHADEAHEHDLGLLHDLQTLRQRATESAATRAREHALRPIGRRRALGFLGGGAAAALLAACAKSGSTTATSGSSSTTGGGSSSTGGQSGSGTTPEETAGPYPGDGSNGPDVLSESGVVRSDITSSFGDLSGTADGIPLEIRMTITEGGAAQPGAAVYLWHCDRDGRYSLYSQGVTDQNYLRGVQEADENGEVVFTSIFPACYDGRWPHIHYEVYPSLDAATSVGNKVLTSQIALPAEACQTVYATSDYSSSAQTFSGVSLDTDMVFSDGYDHELGAVTGTVDDGFVVRLTTVLA